MLPMLSIDNPVFKLSVVNRQHCSVCRLRTLSILSMENPPLKLFAVDRQHCSACRLTTFLLTFSGCDVVGSPIIEITTDIGLKKLPDGEVGSPHAHTISPGVREMGEDKEGKLGGFGNGGVGAAEKGDPALPKNVESDSSSDSDDSLSDLNELEEESLLVPAKVEEVRKARRLSQLNYCLFNRVDGRGGGYQLFVC